MERLRTREGRLIYFLRHCWMKEPHVRLVRYEGHAPFFAQPLVFNQPGSRHSALRFRRLHEGAPDEAGAQILGHEHRNARVDSDHVGIIPVLEWIERVNEAVLGPRRGVSVADRLQYPHRRRGREWQRPSGRTRDHGAINRPRGWRTTPNHIAILGIGSGDSPQVVVVICKLLLTQLYTETPVDFSRSDGIQEIVRIFVAAAAEVEPRLRVLVHKKRRK